MRRRLTAGLTALMMMGMAAPMGVMPEMAGLVAHAGEVASGTCGENLTWVLDDEGMLIVSGSGKMRDFDSSMITNKDCIRQVIINDGVTSIGIGAFADCQNLSTVTISNSVTNIGRASFKNCTSLKEINLPANIIDIEYDPFEFCANLTAINVSEYNQNYASKDGILFTKDMKEIIRYPSGKTNSNYSIPINVTSIGKGAFSNCRELSYISLSESVSNIESLAFQGCINLKSINIPKNVKTIKDRAFWSCSKIQSITIPEGVTNIEFKTFTHCKNLTYVIIPETVTSIESDAFDTECSKKLTIYGTPGSYAETYATENDILFKPISEFPLLSGDINADGILGVTDIIMLQKYILAAGSLNAPDAADLNNDGVIDIFDLGLIKRLLLNQ